MACCGDPQAIEGNIEFPLDEEQRIRQGLQQPNNHDRQEIVVPENGSLHLSNLTPPSVDTFDERRQRANYARLEEHFILEKLSAAGVTSYIIPDDSPTIAQDLKQVVIQTASRPTNSKSVCVLEDTSNGKLKNLLLDMATVPTSTQHFSATLALATLMIMSRSVALLFDISTLELFRHNMVWTLILGLIVPNELSKSWYHVRQRGLPSVAAYRILHGSPTPHDWIRSLVYACWIIGSTIHYDHVAISQNFTLAAIMLTIVVLSVNLGSRSSIWPSEMVASSPSSYLWAFGLAFGMGLLVPQSCYGQDPIILLRSSILAFVGFVVSGPVFVLIAKDDRYQTTVNIVVTIWWTLSMIFSWLFVFPLNSQNNEEPGWKKRVRQWNLENDNRNLQPSPIASPVGYIVPNFADHILPFPQRQERKNLKLIYLWGLFVPVGVGGLILFLSLNPTTQEWLLWY